MRICIVGNSGSVHIKRWAQHLIKEDYEVHIISHGKNTIDGAVVHNLLTVSKLNFFTGPIQTWAIIKKIKPDVVHAFQVTPYGFHAAASSFHPLIVTALGSDIADAADKSCIIRSLCSFTFKRADLVHTGDRSGKRRLLELGCDEKKIFIQPWGVDTNKFTPEARSQKLKEELGLVGNYSIMNLCYLNYPHYNVDVIIRAMPEVLKNVENVKLIIAGSGKLEAGLKKLAEELGVGDHIIFLGGLQHEKVPEYMATADLYVDAFFPLTQKTGGGLGISTVEAMACGTPQVVARRPEVMELGERFGGLVFEPNNPKDLAEKLVYLFKNKKVKEDISTLSRDTALNLYAWSKNMREWEIIYDKLTKTGKGV